MNPNRFLMTAAVALSVFWYPEITYAQSPKQKTKASFALGDVVRPRFFLRNAGKTPIEVTCPRLINHAYYRELKVFDKDGRRVSVHDSINVATPVGWLSVRLGSSEIVEIDGASLSVGAADDKHAAAGVLDARPETIYSMQYAMPNYGNRKANDLQSGEFWFSVLAKGSSERTGSRFEKSNIAWGMPGSNGLQVGVVLLPLTAVQGRTPSVSDLAVLPSPHLRCDSPFVWNPEQRPFLPAFRTFAAKRCTRHPFDATFWRYWGAPSMRAPGAGFEPAQNLRRVHAGFDKLERDAALKREKPMKVGLADWAVS